MKKIAIASMLGLAVVSSSITIASANQTLNDRVAIRFGPFFPSIDTHHGREPDANLRRLS